MNFDTTIIFDDITLPANINLNPLRLVVALCSLIVSSMVVIVAHAGTQR